MRHALFCVLVLLPAAAAAQVSTNNQALDQLKPTEQPPATAAAPAEQLKAHPRHSTRTPAHAAAVKKAPPATKATPRKPQPLPAGPPPNPVIAPAPFVMPEHAPPPPPPVPVRADAEGTATALPGKLERITFGPGSSDLNPATVAAIRDIAAQAIASPTLLVTITAWAAGNTDDPSTPRRVSLDRALAARAVLINAGVISERIHAVAKGFNDPGSGPIDRVDITTSLPAAPSSK